jgi:hypothetical protein
VELDGGDNGDGTYTVRYRTETAGAYRLHVTFGTAEVAASPYDVTVEPGAFHCHTA